MSGTVEVTYLSLKSVYSVQDSYKLVMIELCMMLMTVLRFPLAQSHVQCTCDCPGGVSHCQGGVASDLCSNATHCHTYYSPSHPASDCLLDWLSLSASLCCQIRVSALPGPVYRAVRLGVPSVVATFRTVLRGAGGEVADRREFTVNLNTGAVIDW